MSAFRLLLKDFSVIRLWNVWTRTQFIHSVVRRCKRDRGVRDVLHRFRQAFLRPHRTLLLSVTAAYKTRDEDDPPPPGCDQNITDDEIQALLTELDGVEVLSKNTLFCTGCGRRLVIDKKHDGVRYCMCKNAQVSEESSDGWVPYMEAEDVIIWRKEYKAGQGLYAYKVYGRYKEVRAEDFAAVQVDSAYRRVWDAAVAALAVVENAANGVKDQAVLHWEVLWPRLFANRDYVYIRRQKEFEIQTKSLPHKDSLFPQEIKAREPIYERPSVHSNAKRKAMEAERDGGSKTRENKVYVIVSKSCEHPDVPETKHAIRVTEYWSHMVVKTIDGADKPGMEFVLTYYDEPAVGGLPSGVAAWASGRAAPAYLQRMRAAAREYHTYIQHVQDVPQYTAVDANISYVGEVKETEQIREEDMTTSKQGPELNNQQHKNQYTQTEVVTDKRDVDNADKTIETTDKNADTTDKNVDTTEKSNNTKENIVDITDKSVNDSDVDTIPPTSEESENTPEDEDKSNGWWRYLHPFYYFV